MISKVTLLIKGGRGGRGCVSFRREKYVPKGGPDGGNGGDGGHIIIAGDSSLSTLLDLSYMKMITGGRGGDGRSNNRHGKNGGNRIQKVPFGTELWRLNADGSRVLLADIVDQEAVVIAKGGRGGKGNAKFVTPSNQEPVLAEQGDPGETATLTFELKLLADVGIVGKPNAGKSTLLSTCTRATPKIADYPFTTIEPELGVVTRGDNNFVLMDIPGLLDGAHRGVGLGHEFLQHIQRTRALIYLLDGESVDPKRELKEIQHEVDVFDPSVPEKPCIIAVNKIDIPDVRNKITALKEEFELITPHVYFISAATGEGVTELILEAGHMLSDNPLSPVDRKNRSSSRGLNRVQNRVRVEKDNNRYIVDCPAAERLINGANLDDWRVVVQLRQQMARLGVDDELEQQGICPGDTVYIGGIELEWI